MRNHYFCGRRKTTTEGVYTGPLPLHARNQQLISEGYQTLIGDGYISFWR